MFEAININRKIKVIVEHDEYVGYYVYVYEIGSDTPIKDHLCDDLEQVYRLCEDDFDIKKSDFTRK